MENLAPFCTEDIKRAAEDERETESIPLPKNSMNRYKKQSQLNQISRNCKKEDAYGKGRIKKEGLLQELQNDLIRAQGLKH